jgi:hypothetical protein
MVRLCARPGCNEAAAASFNFDGLRRVVWLTVLDETTGRSAGDLCGTHADRMKPPRQWELHDLRAPDAAVPVTLRSLPKPAAKKPKTPLLQRAFRAAKAG